MYLKRHIETEIYDCSKIYVLLLYRTRLVTRIHFLPYNYYYFDIVEEIYMSKLCYYCRGGRGFSLWDCWRLQLVSIFHLRLISVIVIVLDRFIVFCWLSSGRLQFSKHDEGSDQVHQSIYQRKHLYRIN
jgi:hypothetical protein